MNTLLENLRIEDIKSNAKNLKRALDALGTTLTHSTALNLSSQGFGFKDYNTAKAALSDKKLGVINSSEYEDAISVLDYQIKNHAYYFNDKENIKEFIETLHFKLNDEDLILFLQHEFFPKMKTVLGHEMNWLSLFDKRIWIESFCLSEKKELFPGNVVYMIPNKKITQESEEEAYAALNKILKALLIDRDFTKVLALDGDYFSLFDNDQFRALLDTKNDFVLSINYNEKTFSYRCGSNFTIDDLEFTNRFMTKFCDMDVLAIPQKKLFFNMSSVFKESFLSPFAHKLLHMPIKDRKNIWSEIGKQLEVIEKKADVIKMIENHLKEDAPRPFIVVSDIATVNQLKEKFSKELQYLQQFNKARIFREGRKWGLKVFDICTDCEFRELPPAIIKGVKIYSF